MQTIDNHKFDMTDQPRPRIILQLRVRADGKMLTSEKLNELNVPVTGPVVDDYCVPGKKQRTQHNHPIHN